MFSGIDGRDKFVLDGYPESYDQYAYFEAEVAKIAAAVYTTSKGAPNVQVCDDQLSQMTLDTIYQMENKLKIMKEWDNLTFEEHMGNRTYWGLLVGNKLQGVAGVKEELVKMLGLKCINMSAVEEDLKKSMGTEDEPFEGEVPLAKVEQAICDMVCEDKAAGSKCTYLFDTWLHKSCADFLNFVSNNFDCPQWVINCDSSA